MHPVNLMSFALIRMIYPLLHFDLGKIHPHFYFPVFPHRSSLNLECLQGLTVFERRY